MKTDPLSRFISLTAVVPAAVVPVGVLHANVLTDDTAEISFRDGSSIIRPIYHC